MTVAPESAIPGGLSPGDLPRPAWRLAWLTPARCRIILLIVLAFDVFGHVRYLNDNCPIDLSGDEAQYWDWSRQLDWSYYSKGPLVAYIIRGSCAIFGDTMPGVRYPAIAFAAGTSIVTYLLTKRLFGSERLALGAVLINHLVPMFIAGSVLMTIDPPMFFCWALATWLAAGALFNGQKWAWPLVGLAIGIGFLAKYAATLWFGGLLIFMLVDPASRRHLRTPWPWIAFVISLLMTLPVIIWNMRNGWVSFRHVARQTGASGGGIWQGNLLEFVGSQVGVVGPVLAVLMFAASVATVRSVRAKDPQASRPLFLMVIGLFFFGLTLIVSIFSKVQVNWPAPAYFTLMILVAWYLGTRLRSIESWRPWRGWFWGTVVLGIVIMPIAHDSAVLFPIVRGFNSTFGTNISPWRLDVIRRLRGWKMLGDHVSAQLEQLGPGAFVLCDDYQQTAEMAFYVKGQPKTFYAGSWFADAKRRTQYDLWPDRRLDAPELIGRNAVFVGKRGGQPKDILKAFERVEELPELPVIIDGEKVQTYKTWVGYGFKGMTRSDGPGDY